MRFVEEHGDRGTVGSFFLCFCAVFSIVSFSGNGETVSHGWTSPIQRHSILNPTVEFLGPYETMVVWQLPPKGPVRKVLALFAPRTAGTGASATLFWDASPSCPICAGLPESRKIIIDALSRNYAVIVPTSITAKDGGDWRPEVWQENSPDLENAAYLISEWKRTHGIEKVPTVGLGMSAGGHAVATLGLREGFFQSVTLMISGGREEVGFAATVDYPPTLYLHMPKDERTGKDIAAVRRILVSKGVKTKEVKWYEHRVTDDWFAQLIPGLTLSTSRALVSAFKQARILDENNFVLNGGYDTDWPSCVKKILPADPSRHGHVMFEDSISQELNVAFAEHSTLARKNEDMFAWFEGSYQTHPLDMVLESLSDS